MTETGPNSLEALFRDKFYRSQSGDAAAAGAAAILIHTNWDIVQRTGLVSKYDSLLQQAFLTNDADILIGIGELLCEGRALARDLKFAARFFSKSAILSPFKGNYMLARLSCTADPDLAFKLFRKSESEGHIASGVFKRQLIKKRLGILSFAASPLFYVMDMLSIWLALRSGIDLQRKFWRYKDFMGRQKESTPVIDPDREEPFKDVLLAIDVQSQSDMRQQA